MTDDGRYVAFASEATNLIAGDTNEIFDIFVQDRDGVVGAPSVTGFNPTSGPVGTSVTISGTNLGGATAVTFNGTNQPTFTVNGAGTQVTAAVPTGATTGKIAVTTPSGTATSAGNFTVTVAPTITGFSPNSGPVGTSVTINGTNFTGATAVKFNGVNVTSFTVNSATQIATTVPAGATTGKITVTTPGGTATSANNFTVTVLRLVLRWLRRWPDNRRGEAGRAVDRRQWPAVRQHHRLGLCSGQLCPANRGQGRLPG
jgi:hypothetical protein